MFEKASRLKLRFQTKKGLLSSEDLWDLNLSQLNDLAKDLNKEIKDHGEEDFLKVDNKEEKLAKLSFDIVLHVLRTKQAEQEAAENALANKAKKQKLMQILEEKQNESFKDMTPEQIQAEISKLS